MSTQVQHRRGTSAQHEAFTGAMSEITHDTTNNNLRVHDGQKAGGYATLMEHQRGVANGVASLDERGLVPEDQLLNAPVADGSVTDPKLPDYDPGTSPSAAKIRFMASTSSGAIAGAVSRPLDAKLSESLHAADFGVKADGVTNDTTAMVAAFAAMEATGRPLFLPAGAIMVDPDILRIGNGTQSGPSSRNGQTLIGAASTPYFSSGTRIVARKAGNVLLTISGTMSGLEISGVSLRCGGVCGVGIDMYSVNESSFKSIQVSDFTDYGINIGCTPYPIGIVSWSAGNVFERLFITSNNVKPYGAGIRINGNPNPPAPNRLSDPHRLTFIQAIVQVNKNAGGPTSGIELGMTDSNAFIECDFSAVGDGLGSPVVFIGAQDTNGTVYPVNNFFYGCSLQGGAPEVRGDIWDNTFINYTTRDGETVPSHPKLRGITDRGQMFGDWSVERLSAEVLFNGDTVAKRRLRFSTPDGAQQMRLTHNAEFGFEVEVWTGSDWLLALRLYADGQVGMNFSGVGFRILGAGSADSAGVGRRSISIQN